MNPLLNSFLLVAIAEIGDKTQLLSLVLATRFKRPWLIIWGILLATLANHWPASFLGGLSSTFIPSSYRKLAMAAVFLFFSVWLLIPDKQEELKTSSSLGVFLTTFISFFMAEMGDKTQLATVALGAQYQDSLMITIGSTFGMLVANVPVVFLGKKILGYIPLKGIRIVASLMYLVFALYVLLRP